MTTIKHLQRNQMSAINKLWGCCSINKPEGVEGNKWVSWILLQLTGICFLVGVAPS